MAISSDGANQGRTNSGLRYVLVDVFTNKPLEGNQLAVFTDARGIASEQMQRLAREMNLSESVFVLPAEQGGDARIRIFTPANELPFAGHPVLGSAFVIGDPLQRNHLRLETGKGIVPLELTREGIRIVFCRMQQPIPTWRRYEREAELLAALGVSARDCRWRRTRTGRCTCMWSWTVRRRWPRSSLILRPWRACPGLAPTALRARGGAGKLGCLRQPTAFRKIPPPGRRLDHWPSISHDTAGSTSARRLRSAKGRKFDAHRFCTPERTVHRRKSSASR